jgi:UDP-glucose 4-epimerase
VKLQKKRILVTGGAGFIGSHLVELLAEDNHVTVLDDFSVGSRENLDAVRDRVEIREGDVADLATVSDAARGCEVVFHLAVACLRAVIRDPMLGLRVNELGSLNVVLAARDLGVERVVYVSSSEVYGTAHEQRIDEDHPLNPETPYAAGKLAGEMQSLSFWRTYGLPVTIVRPFNSYGPRSHLLGPSGEVIPRFVARTLAGWPLVIFGDGEQTRDFTWVEDTAVGIKLAGESDELVGDRINIARGEEVSVLALTELIQRSVGRETPIENSPARPGDVRRHLADVAKSQTLLGFAPPVGIQEGLRRYVDWVRQLPGDPASWLEGEEVQNWLP